MSEVNQLQPDIIRFENEWACVPKIHNQLKGLNQSASFISWESNTHDYDISRRNVVWSHMLEKPETHSFTSLTPKSLDDSYKVYDFTIDESQNQARLHVFKTLGRTVTGSQTNSEKPLNAENIWHALQLETNSMLPNNHDLKNFGRLFFDFYKQIIDVTK